MRQRLVLASLATVASLALGTLGACGGSSSETPPPLQPDPKGFHYASVPPPPAVAEGDAGGVPMASDLEDDEKPRAPGRATWGSPKPTAH
ncbi:MAG: hypothetical protein ABUL62_01540 [Myxococcales bacterium]